MEPIGHILNHYLGLNLFVRELRW
ncbi:uncharacterized protein METZ01_LOCUS438785, partial [marine metagenome]